MNNNIETPNVVQQIQDTPKRRERRKITREVAERYEGIARAAGFSPAERRAAFTLSTKIYEKPGESYDTPRPLSLATIGKGLTSKSDNKEACEAAARRHYGDLFNHSIPRTGYQL